MNKYRHLHLEMDREILSVQLDVQEHATNPLLPEVLAELVDVYQQLHILRPKGIILSSAKAMHFSSGLDNHWLTNLNNSEELQLILELGQTLCRTIETCAITTVATIQGQCWEAGFELVLACPYRIASINATVGFQHIEVGRHTVFNGLRRSVQLLGPEQALTAQLLSTKWTGQQAQQIGLVNECVPQEKLYTTAYNYLQQPCKSIRKPYSQSGLYKFLPARKLLVNKINHNIAIDLPISLKMPKQNLLSIWQQYGGSDCLLDKAELDSALKLASSDSSKQLSRLESLRQGLILTYPNLKTTSISIYVIGSNEEGNQLVRACQQQGFLVNQANRLVPLLSTIAQADIILDLQDNLISKQQLFQQLERQVKADTLLVTYNIRYALKDIAAFMLQPQRLVGVYYPNPFLNNSLVEVACELEASNNKSVQKTCQWLRQLNKLPLVINSTPGLLVQRILLPYLWEAIRLQQQGIPAPIIDKVAQEFGLPLGPLEMADSLGLDYCQQLGEVLQKKLGVDIPLTIYQLIRDGKLGKKTSKGCHNYRKGVLIRHEEAHWHGNLQRLQERLLSPILREAQNCLNEALIASPDLLDLAIVHGFGFPADTGGPLTYRKKIS